MNVNLVMFAFEAYTPISVVLLSIGMIISPSLFVNHAPPGTWLQTPGFRHPASALLLDPINPICLHFRAPSGEIRTQRAEIKRKT